MKLVGRQVWVAVTAIGLILISLYWILLNLSYQPLYGDTGEYWTLAHTLNIDSWRTIAYPLLLHIGLYFSSLTTTRYFVYILQIVVSFLASYYFFLTLNAFTNKKYRDGRWVIVFLSFLLLAMPVISHLSLTILTDSLANSFFIVGIMSLARVIFLKNASYVHIALAAISVFLACLMREEKAIVFFVIIVFAATWAINKRLKSLAIPIIIVSSILVCAIGINKLTQHPNPARPPLSITSSLFERTTRGTLLTHYSNMPALMRQRITLDLAQRWANDEVYTSEVLNHLRDKPGQQAMQQAIVISLRCCGVQVAGTAFGDFLEYSLAPLTYAKETLWASHDPTAWTNTRMGAPHPRITKIYLWYSFVVTALALLIVILNIKKGWLHKKLVIYLAFIILFVSLMFSARSSLDFNIRYGLPIYTIETGLLLWGAWRVVRDSN